MSLCVCFPLINKSLSFSALVSNYTQTSKSSAAAALATSEKYTRGGGGHKQTRGSLKAAGKEPESDF